MDYLLCFVLWLSSARASTLQHQIPLSSDDSLASSAVSAPAAGFNLADVGRLPAMGFNTWNAHRMDINEKKVLTAANKIIEFGLKDLGYEYVNIDDAWSIKGRRDSKTKRMVPDPDKFPRGIKGVAKEVHSMGLKLGIYSTAGTATCAGYPASLGHEMVDAETFAEWGIDYLKYDNCNVPREWYDECNFCVPDNDNYNDPKYPNGTCPDIQNPCPPDYDYSKSKTAQRFNTMRDALAAQKRPILYSLCEWGNANVQTWGNQTGHSWRATGDIRPQWTRIKELINENSFYLNYVNFYGHSDPDMLEVGNGDLTLEDSRTHFALWAAMKSPLLIGTPLDAINDETLEILKNRYLIEFNQDPIVGEPAMPYKWGRNPDWTWNSSWPAEYWSGKSSNGTMVLIINTADETRHKIADWSEVPGLKGGASYKVIDAWTGKSLGCQKYGVNASIPAHDTSVLLVQDQCGHGHLRERWWNRILSTRWGTWMLKTRFVGY